MTATNNRGWNLFARVLEEILVERGMGLGYLDDRAWIHPEKVRRLQRSLSIPKSFPMLNPDEMERVFRVFKFTIQEKIHLRAAVLATAVEVTLMDRIRQDDALKVAEQVLPMIEQALWEHANESVGLGAVKGEIFLMSYDAEIDRKMGSALAAIDEATMILHLGRNADSYAEQIKCAKQAMDDFKLALTQLYKADIVLKESLEWQMWCDEAQHGLDTVKQLLLSLGVQLET